MKMVSLGEVLTEYKRYPGPNDDFPVLTLTEKNGFIRQSERFNKRLATDDTSKYKVVGRFHLAFNPYLLWAGALAQNTNHSTGVISPLYPTFKVDDYFDPSFVYRLLLTPEMIQRYDSIAYGSVPRRRRSSVADFLSLEVPMPPPLDEQHRIASILDKADAIRLKRRQAIDHLDTLTQSLLSRVLQSTSERTSLRDLIKDGPKNGLYRPKSAYGTGTPIVRIDSFNYGSPNIRIDSLKRLELKHNAIDEFSLKEGDILINRVNSKNYVGKTALIGPLHEPVVFESNMMRIRLETKRIRERFFAEFMQTQDVRRQLAPKIKDAINQSSINQQDVKMIEVPMPPIKVQDAFVRAITDLDSQRTAMESLARLADKLFASLQSRAFRGEL